MIPDVIVAFAARHGEAGAAWLDRLPDLIERSCSAWGVALDGPLAGGGSAAWVGAGTRADGAEVVLKIAWPHKEAETEAAGLRAFDGRGAVRLLEADEADFVLLLERCRPGDELWGVPFDEALAVAAEVLQRLWRAPRPGDAGTITTLAATVEAWNAGHATGATGYPPDLVAAAARLGTELVATTEEVVVVHGDFNPFNVVRAQREPWLAIDPKPLLGDRAYDLAQFLVNYDEQARSSGDPKRFYGHAIASFADALGLDPFRIAGWAFVKSIGWTWSVPLAQLFGELADDAR